MRTDKKGEGKGGREGRRVVPLLHVVNVEYDEDYIDRGDPTPTRRGGGGEGESNTRHCECGVRQSRAGQERSKVWILF